MNNYTLGQKAEIDFGEGWSGITPENQKPAIRANGTVLNGSDHFDFLRENHLQFREALPFGCITINDKGIIKRVNQKACEMMGVEKDHLIGTTFLPRVQNDDQEKIEFSQSGLAGPGQGPFDIRLMNGEDLLWVRVTPMSGSHTILSDELFDFFLYDIDELKRLELENTALKNKLQQSQKLEAIGELSSGIAHDFNNILHPIIGSLELLIDDSASDKKLKSDLETVLKGANRASSLVKQILSFCHQSSLEICPVKIQSIVREVLKLSRSTLPATIKIIQTIDNGCGPVNADPTHVYQIAMNLVTNAFHAMDHGGGILDVNLKEVEITGNMPEHLTLNPGAYVCLGVGDTGKGIDPSIMDKIFEPYFTTKEKGSGTGLGLSFIADMIKNYGGDICCSSQVGKGSLFQVYFPKNGGSFNTNSFKVDKKKDLYGEETILFVDDDPFIVEIQKETLERHGYRVAPFVNSLDALGEFKSQPDQFDMVICDMTMPSLTGLALANKIKEVKPHIPVIICTGFSDQINKENFHDMGVDGFLMKPVTKDASLKLIRQILDKD